MDRKTTHIDGLENLINLARVLLQFFPLTVFLRVALLHGAPQTEDWLLAFAWGGGVAVVQLVLFVVFARARPMNRLMLGVNVYLILGGAAVLSNQIGLLQALRDLQESGIFLCLLLVGMGTTLASPAGFVGAPDVSGQRDVQVYSLILLGLAGAGMLASFVFRGQMVFSAAIPLIVLSLATRVFQRRLAREDAPAHA